MTEEMKTEAQVIRELESRSMRRLDLAKELGITPQYLYDLLKGNRPVSARVAKAMGYKRKVVFVRAK